MRLRPLQSPPATAVLPGGGQSSGRQPWLRPPSPGQAGIYSDAVSPAPAAEKPLAPPSFQSRDPWAPPSVGKVPATFSSFSPGPFCGALSAWLLFTHRHLVMVPETCHPELDADLQPWREAPLEVKHERPNCKLVGGGGSGVSLRNEDSCMVFPSSSFIKACLITPCPHRYQGSATSLMCHSVQ